MKPGRERKRARRPSVGAPLATGQRPESGVVEGPDATHPAWLGRVTLVGPSGGRKLAPRTLAGVGAALLLLIPMLLWAYYQLTYVVSRNAQVKGYITQVGAQLDGVVTGVEVEVGQRVKAGEVLARFEDHQLQANLQRARSRLSKATRELEVERLAIDQEARRLAGQVLEASARTDAARAQTVAARTRAEDARVKYSQRQTLSAQGLIAPEELRSAETTQRTAEALAATARADESAAEAAQRLALVESEGLSVRERHLEVLEAEVAALTAELNLAGADLAAAIIRAPQDGWVVRRIAEPGSSVVVGQPVVALWIGKEIWVEAWVEEGELSKVARATKPASPSKPTLAASTWVGSNPLVSPPTSRCRALQCP